MLIRSTKDYYDSAAGMGIDSSIVYQRETRMVELKSNFLIDNLPCVFPDEYGVYVEGYDADSVDDWNRREHCHFSVIGFCGEQIVCLTNLNRDQHNRYTMVFFGEEILSLDWSGKKRRRHPSERQVVENCINQFHRKSHPELFSQLNTPIFSVPFCHQLNHYEQKNESSYASKFTINPNLDSYRFFRYKDTVTAFQEIQSYLSSNLVSPTKSIVELTDQSRIIKAGFDLKTSFRKPKQNERK